MPAKRRGARIKIVLLVLTHIREQEPQSLDCGFFIKDKFILKVLGVIGTFRSGSAFVLEN